MQHQRIFQLPLTFLFFLESEKKITNIFAYLSSHIFSPMYSFRSCKQMVKSSNMMIQIFITILMLFIQELYCSGNLLEHTIDEERELHYNTIIFLI